MKTEITSVMPSGYGHKKVTIQFRDGKEYSAFTDNMPLVDSYRRDIITAKDEREYRSAKIRLIRLVKERNGLR